MVYLNRKSNLAKLFAISWKIHNKDQFINASIVYTNNNTDLVSLFATPKEISNIDLYTDVSFSFNKGYNRATFMIYWQQTD